MLPLNGPAAKERLTRPGKNYDMVLERAEVPVSHERRRQRG